MSTSDLGNYIMKLFDPLIAESKMQLGEKRDTFLQAIPRQFSTHTSVPVYQAENFVKDISAQLITINQELLNKYSISIAKKVRSYVRQNMKDDSADTENFQAMIEKKDAEVEGLQKKVASLEKRAKTLEGEKEETLRQFSKMNTAVIELESQLTTIQMQHEQQINNVTAEWEEKFRKQEEEWDSYVKLKLAEQEVQSSLSGKLEEE
jgi:chromosome segregation ATPase